MSEADFLWSFDEGEGILTCSPTIRFGFGGKDFIRVRAIVAAHNDAIKTLFAKSDACHGCLREDEDQSC